MITMEGSAIERMFPVIVSAISRYRLHDRTHLREFLLFNLQWGHKSINKDTEDDNAKTDILNSKDIQQSVNTIHDPSHNGRKLTNDRSAALCR